MVDASEFKKMYDQASKELADLLLLQAEVESSLIRVRKNVASFATLCENNGIEIEPSAEAEYLLKTSLADEIRNLLKANYEREFRPSVVKEELKTLGRDLTRYNNPQSAIHMVLKRMVESGEVTERIDVDGKSSYLMEDPIRRAVRGFDNLRATFTSNDRIASAIAAIAKNASRVIAPDPPTKADIGGKVDAVPPHIRDFRQKDKK